ncbi:hypothetical protein SD70_03400 [Gordoniibacillus kamchatkensis]|uniref:Uncharacterized protein n=1 Tax=Gordoniibacillus kamchatkensis TaxID=1590651 RepID=A0ABR5ALM9_9BACL|nr:hypothetical protein [Paenibacillus sp. VKM B-2647]KIL41936.1 hypothetical protein SD70_03400 [Paenibacillus sp. VKM B-2647]
MKAKEIPNYIRNLEDNQVHIEKYIDLIYVLQRKRGPVLEAVTLIRFEKPIIYSILKRRFQNNNGLNMLFSLAMDYQVALSNLLCKTNFNDN